MRGEREMHEATATRIHTRTCMHDVAVKWVMGETTETEFTAGPWWCCCRCRCCVVCMCVWLCNISRDEERESSISASHIIKFVLHSLSSPPLLTAKSVPRWNASPCFLRGSANEENEKEERRGGKQSSDPTIIGTHVHMGEWVFVCGWRTLCKPGCKQRIEEQIFEFQSIHLSFTCVLPWQRMPNVCFLSLFPSCHRLIFAPLSPDDPAAAFLHLSPDYVPMRVPCCPMHESGQLNLSICEALSLTEITCIEHNESWEGQESRSWGVSPCLWSWSRI